MKFQPALALALSAIPLFSQNPNHLPKRLPKVVTGATISRAATTTQLEVVVRLSDPPLAAVAGSPQTGITMTPAQKRAYVQQLRQRQDGLMAQIAGLGGRELARLSRAHNAIVVTISSTRVGALQALPGVTSVRAVPNYSLALSTVVPYVGGTAVQNLGYTGKGIVVAVLDSGIDYTHRNFGGAGTTAAYRAAWGTSPSSPQNKSRDGLFPTAKVVEGFDFVGEAWPNGPRTEDPDPIDRGGHGSHVADIIGGKSNDGTHKGMAPDASLLAVKVCSAITTSCNGVAILKGVDYALDPDGDPGTDDMANIINLSLGSDFGQREDDLTEACRMASRAGVVVVAAAGNGGNIPYIAGSPANSPAVISVAETTMPNEIAYRLRILNPPLIAGYYPNTATVPWAPIASGFMNSEVAYVGQGCPAEGSTPADPYLDNPSGKVALIDRGTCNISVKVDRAAKAGAIGVLLGLIAPGDAVSFSFGGGTDFVPTLVITQDVSEAIKDRIAATRIVRVSVNSNTALPLSGNMVSTSSRGPGYSYQSIKPDIGAPGASISAEVGTGNGETGFGGTSGAAPVVAGASALLLQSCPTCTPLEIKARLMNTANSEIYTNVALQPGMLAPVTRIGAGEVRVDRAVAARTMAWDAADPESVSLSMGYSRLTGSGTWQKKVVVRNLNPASRTYTITRSWRSATEQNSGALALSTPSSITVPGNGMATFTLSAMVMPSLLPPWLILSGSMTGNGTELDDLEFDGYVTIADASDSISLPWHILPQAASRIQPSTSNLALGGRPRNFRVSNTGATGDFVDLFALVGTSPQLPPGAFPSPGDNYALIDLRAFGTRLIDFGGGDYALEFAINTFGERSHPSTPATFYIDVDTDMNGIPNFWVFNYDLGLFLGSPPNGQSVVAVQPLNAAGNPSGFATAYFYTYTGLNTADVTMTVPLAALGISPDTKIRCDLYGQDNYYTGALTDAIFGAVFTPGIPRFSTMPYEFVGVGQSANITVRPVSGGNAASPSQTGLMLMYTAGPTGQEYSQVTVTP